MTSGLIVPRFEDQKASPAREDPTANRPAGGGRTAEGKILVVEDERELAEVLEYNLRLQGYSILTAEDGLTACRLAGSEKPDLILLDILLPDLDGWEICKLIRGHHLAEIASIPIIMLTALGSPNDRLKGLELGADAYIAKPYSLKEVTATVRNLLARHKSHQALAGELERHQRREELLSDIQALLFHELRNQVVVLDGYTHLLHKAMTDDTRPNESRSYIDAISRSSGYLSTLAEEFFLINHLESNSLDLPCQLADLHQVASHALELCQPLARERQVTIDFPGADGPLQAWLNPIAAKLVVVNLLDNAIRYGVSGTPVRLSLKACPPDHVELEISNRGQGIPEDEIPRLFEKFFRGRQHEKTARGSGLGLYFVKILTRAMGGTVSVRSVSDEGTTFFVRLRLEAPTGPSRDFQEH